MTNPPIPLWTVVLAALLLVPPSVRPADSPAATSDGGLPQNSNDPPASEIVRRVATRWEAEPENKAAFLARYAFTHRQVTENWDSKGTLKEREEETKRHDPQQADENGPLERRGPGYKPKDFQDTEALIQRFDFHLDGRHEVGGRNCWLLRFRPKEPPVPARNLKERFVNAVAGRVWVDIEDYVPVRCEMQLIREVGVIGGLVGNVRRCEVAFERQRTSEGLWFTPRFSWQLEGRTLFAQKRLTHREEKFDLLRQDD